MPVIKAYGNANPKQEQHIFLSEPAEHTQTRETTGRVESKLSPDP